MTKDEKRAILSAHLAKFRTWSYVELMARTGGDPLEIVEGVAPDGTTYQMDFDVFWDVKPHGDVRVCGYLCGNPQKPLLGFMPIYLSDVSDGFIMSPDGRFVGEDPISVS